MNNKQEISVKINNKKFFSGVVVKNQKIKFDFITPNSQMLLMKIQIPNAISPFNLNLNSDKRNLGIAINSLKIVDISD